jgi:hypothetical protein
MLPAYAPLIGSVAQQGAIAAAPAYLFEAYHEGGNLTEWTGTTVEGSNTLAINSTSPIAGTYDAKGVLDGTNKDAYLYKTGFTNLTEVWAYLKIKPTSVADVEWPTMYILSFNDATAQGIAVGLQYNNSDGGRLRLYNHAGTAIYGGTNASIVNGTTYTIEAYFKAESGSSAGDGVATLWLDGTQLFTKTDITGSFGLQIDAVRAGFQDWAGGSFDASSALQVDNVIVDDQGRIGPL